VTITPRSLVQSTLINNVIYGEYDCAGWNQFGGVDQSLKLRVVRLTAGDDLADRGRLGYCRGFRPVRRSPVR